MGLRLEIVSRQRQSLGERSTKEFGPDGGTIGRSLESDWVLPDGQRYLSSRHASIDCRAGSYYIIDTSTNGVYVNDSDEPVGRGNPQRLFSGDRVRMGEYVIRVKIEGADSAGDQLTDEPHVDPVDTALRVEAPDFSAGSLLDEHEITGTELDLLMDADESDSPAGAAPQSADELSGASLTLEGTGITYTRTRPDPTAPLSDDEPAAGDSGTHTPAHGDPPRAAPASSGTSASTRPAAPKPQPRRQRADDAEPTAARRAQAPQAGGDPALRAFLNGAGLESRQLEQREVEQLMHTLGHILREAVAGLTESLRLRTAQKSMLKQSDATVRDDNPLKLAASVDESLTRLLFGGSAERVPPVDAVREAFRDVKLHQQALLRALHSALVRYVERLDPERVEEQFASGRRSALLGATNKKYWDYYKDLYLVVSQHPAGELPAQFLEEFAQAYEEEVGKPPDGTAARRRVESG